MGSSTAIGKMLYAIDPKVAGFPSVLHRNGGARLTKLCRLNGGIINQINLFSKLGDMENVIKTMFSHQMVNKLSTANVHRFRHAMPYIGWGVTPFCDDIIFSFYYDWQLRFKSQPLGQEESSPPLSLPHLIVLDMLGYDSLSITNRDQWRDFRDGISSYLMLLSLGCQLHDYPVISHYIVEWPYLVVALSSIVSTFQEYQSLTDESRADIVEAYWAVTRLLDIGIEDAFSIRCIRNLLAGSPAIAADFKSFAVKQLSMPSDMFRLTTSSMWSSSSPETVAHEIDESMQETIFKSAPVSLQANTMLATVTLLIKRLSGVVTLGKIEEMLEGSDSLMENLKVYPLDTTISFTSHLSERKSKILESIRSRQKTTEGEDRISLEHGFVASTEFSRNLWVDKVMQSAINTLCLDHTLSTGMANSTRMAMGCLTYYWAVELNLPNEVCVDLNKQLLSLKGLDGGQWYQLTKSIGSHFDAYKKTKEYKPELTDPCFQSVMDICNSIWQDIGIMFSRGEQPGDRERIGQSVKDLREILMQIHDEALQQDFASTVDVLEHALSDESLYAIAPPILKLMSKWREELDAEKEAIAARDNMIEGHIQSIRQVIDGIHDQSLSSSGLPTLHHQVSCFNPDELQSSNQQLKFANEKLTTRCDELNQLLAEKREQLGTLRRQNKKHRTEGHAHTHKKSVAPAALVLGNRNTNLHEVARGLLAMINGQDDMITVMQAVETFCMGRLRFTSSAYESARDYNRQEYSAEDLVVSLLRLTHHYAPLFIEKGDNHARFVFGNNEYSAGESDTVLNNDRMRLMRMWDIDGVSTLVTKHLAINLVLRLYFTVDKNGVVIVPYCGRHLDCGKTS